MTLAAPKNWPPIIDDAELPRLVVWRDRLLTTAMWVLLIWLSREPLHHVLDQLLYLFGHEPHLGLPDWSGMWARLRPYLTVVGLFGVWLIAWGLISLRRMRRDFRLPQPAALALEEEARRGGCTPADLSEWRSLRVCIVHLDDQGAMTVMPMGPHE